MPLTMREHEASLHHSALCELLPIRDYLDQGLVRTNGALVAGYELGGAHSYYHSDDMRNRMKNALETLVRSLPERSMRMQMRFEVVEGLGDQRPHRGHRDRDSGGRAWRVLCRETLCAVRPTRVAGFGDTRCAPG